MADGPAVQIEQTLNEVLTRINETEDQTREVERNARRLSEQLAQLDREARGLRLALFALAGEPTDEDEANRQNSKMRQELRRARR